MHLWHDRSNFFQVKTVESFRKIVTVCVFFLFITFGHQHKKEMTSYKQHGENQWNQVVHQQQYYFLVYFDCTQIPLTWEILDYSSLFVFLILFIGCILENFSWGSEKWGFGCSEQISKAKLELENKVKQLEDEMDESVKNQDDTQTRIQSLSKSVNFLKPTSKRL